MKTLPAVPLICDVFGPPGRRCVQCPFCCERVALHGHFRGWRFHAPCCGSVFDIAADAVLRKWG